MAACVVRWPSAEAAALTAEEARLRRIQFHIKRFGEWQTLETGNCAETAAALTAEEALSCKPFQTKGGLRLGL